MFIFHCVGWHNESANHFVFSWLVCQCLSSFLEYSRDVLNTWVNERKERRKERKERGKKGSKEESKKGRKTMRSSENYNFNVIKR